MDTNIQELNDGLKQAVQHLQDELKGIRGGRATPSLVEGIMVEAYGATTPIEQLANVAAPDATSITIEPWDKSVMGDVEKAITESDLGLNPTNEGERIRLKLPPMTEERREEIAKIVADKVEEAKISVRNHREEAMKKIKGSDLSETEQERLEKEAQKAVDAANVDIESVGEAKKKDLLDMSAA